MSIDPSDTDGGAVPDAGRLIARAAAADARADARLSAAIDDFLLPDDARLDDRVRAALAQLVRGMVAVIAGALRQHAARSLAGRDEAALAAALKADTQPAIDRLASAGLLRDGPIMRELIGRVRQEVIAAALPAEAPEASDRPSLLARLTHHGDAVIAARAAALLAAENRRRSDAANGAAMRTELPADLHHRLVWWVAAALRGEAAASAETAPLDRALAEAAARALAAHDESDRAEVAAMRLAAAFDAHAGELPGLLIESLGDRRLALFIALLAHALGLDYADAREIVLDPAADRLWLVLRALELDRTAIARIGLALSDADARRDLDAFVETLDTIAAMPAATARIALAPLMLPADYRAAMLALAHGRMR